MATPLLPSASIDQFDELLAPASTDWMVVYNIATGKTMKSKANNFLTSGPSTNYKWISTFDYPLNAIVEHQGKWYKSLDTPNVGQVPGIQPLFWAEQVSSPSGFVFWQAGVFSSAEVFVLRTVDSFTQVFRLANATRPFLSSNFELEFTSGDWDLMSERGYIGLSKVAHGFVVNDVLTYKAGAWNKYTIGDVQLAIVRQVVDADHFIAVIIRQRLKGLAGLTAGTVYYSQADGTIADTVAGEAVYMAISTTEAILF